jgi:hypothetical protein
LFSIIDVWPQTGSRQAKVVATMGSPGVGVVRETPGGGDVTIGEGEPKACGPTVPEQATAASKPARRAAARKVVLSLHSTGQFSAELVGP